MATGELVAWGLGAAIGTLCGAMARRGVRGPYVDLAYTAVRVAVAQSLHGTIGPHTPA